MSNDTKLFGMNNRITFIELLCVNIVQKNYSNYLLTFATNH